MWLQGNCKLTGAEERQGSYGVTRQELRRSQAPEKECSREERHSNQLLCYYYNATIFSSALVTQSFKTALFSRMPLGAPNGMAEFARYAIQYDLRSDHLPLFLDRYVFRLSGCLPFQL